MKPLPRTAALVILAVSALAPATARGALQWSTIPVAPGPTARYAHTAAFDPDSNRMIVFGSSDRSQETWSLSLNGTPRWERLMTATSPSGRYGASMIYDPVRRRMLMYGGNDGLFRSDVWALSLDGTPNWSLITPTGTTPLTRAYATAVYDSIGDRMVIMGGLRASSTRNDVWALSLSGTPQWAQILPTGPAPSPRYGHVSVCDAPRNRMLMWSGDPGTIAGHLVWVLDLGAMPNWTSLDLANTPQPNVFLAAIRDPVGGAMLVHGGDVQSLGLVGTIAWTAPPILGTPPSPRRSHTAVYDPNGHRMIVFGGFQADALVYALDIPPPSPPPPPPTPVITGFTPMVGVAGDTIVVSGSGFVSVSEVRFNGVPALHLGYEFDWIRVRVPSGATTGPIQVVTSNGVATSATAFTIGFRPRIDSFSPGTACLGEEIVIRGADFTGATRVTLGSAGSVSFTVRSDDEIAAVVGANSGIGPVTVTTMFGSGGSTSQFRKLTHEECLQPPQPSQPLTRLWEPSGRSVVTGPGVQSEPIACSDGSGGAYVAWLDDRGGAGPDLFATHIDHDGNTVSGWTPGGDPICVDASTPEFPKIVSDEQGGAIVAWIDRRTGLERLYALRMTPDAPRHPAWMANGVRVSDDVPSVNRHADLAPDINGGAFFAWVDSREGAQYILRRDGLGQIPAGWEPGGRALGYAVSPPDAVHFTIPRLASDGAGGVFIARSIHSTYCLPEGPCAGYSWTAVERLAGDGMHESGVSLYQPSSFTNLFADGAGGVVLSYGFGNLLTRVGASIPPAVAWQSQVTTLSDAYLADVVASGSGNILTIEGRIPGSENTSLTAMRFTSDGQTPPEWAVNGYRVVDAAETRSSKTISDQQSGAVLAWLNEFQLYGQHIGMDGGLPTSAPQGTILCTATGERRSASLIPSLGLTALLVWQDTRSDEGDLYAQRIAWDGAVPVAYSVAATEAAPGRVLVRWYVPANPGELRVERSQTPGVWREVGRVVPSGGFVWFEDRDIEAGARFGYRLVTASGDPVGEVWVDVPNAFELALRGASPNPSTGPLRIAFSLASIHPARLEVFDVAGRRVYDRLVGDLGPGRHVVTLGEVRMAPGLYLIRLEQNGIRRTTRALVVK